jgi:predicted Rossmann-fold nucleotide-binding protein
MNIFVGGSLSRVGAREPLARRFIERLGEQIVKREHTLLTGCRGSLDCAIAEAAFNWLTAREKDPRRQIVSYRLKNDEPAHRFGRIHVSKRVDWALTHPELNPPEQIAEADVTIFVSGGEGTFSANNWARIANKPILGITLFGGAGAEIYEMERERFDERYAHLVAKSDFDVLNQDTEETDRLVDEVLDLSERVFTSSNAFAIMSYKQDYRDVFGCYEEVCKEFRFTALRTDTSPSSQRIISRILDGIRQSAFVLADVSEPSLNVFYEIGFAEGLGKSTVVTARAGTPLPFDLADIPVEFWNDYTELKEKLRIRLREVSSKLGLKRVPSS